MALEPLYADDVRNTRQGRLSGFLGQLAPEGVSIDERHTATHGDPDGRRGKKRRQLGYPRIGPCGSRRHTSVWDQLRSDGFVRETYNDSRGTLVKKNQKLAAYYGLSFWR